MYHVTGFRTWLYPERSRSSGIAPGWPEFPSKLPGVKGGGPSLTRLCERMDDVATSSSSLCRWGIVTNRLGGISFASLASID